MTYNGPALVEWIEALPESRYLNDGLRRHLRHWRAGHNPGEAAVDSFLCRIFVHLDEVPAYVALGWPSKALDGLELHPDRPRVLRRAA